MEANICFIFLYFGFEKVLRKFWKSFGKVFLISNYHVYIVIVYFKGTRKAGWYIFNDFAITPVSEVS